MTGPPVPKIRRLPAVRGLLTAGFFLPLKESEKTADFSRRVLSLVAVRNQRGCRAILQEQAVCG
nr:hypothetical protein [Bacillaceae bacterium]